MGKSICALVVVFLAVGWLGACSIRRDPAGLVGTWGADPESIAEPLQSIFRGSFLSGFAEARRLRGREPMTECQEDIAEEWLTRVQLLDDPKMRLTLQKDHTFILQTTYELLGTSEEYVSCGTWDFSGDRLSLQGEQQVVVVATEERDIPGANRSWVATFDVDMDLLVQTGGIVYLHRNGYEGLSFRRISNDAR
jgi:hypothetical protein